MIKQIEIAYIKTKLRIFNNEMLRVSGSELQTTKVGNPRFKETFFCFPNPVDSFS